MLISPNEINKLLSIASSDISNKGKKYFERSKVKPSSFNDKTNGDDYEYEAVSYVEDTYLYKVLVKKNKEILSYECECPYHIRNKVPCEHIIATVFNMYINESEYTSLKSKKEVVKINEHLNLISPQVDIVEKSNLKRSNLTPKVYNEEIQKRVRNNILISYYENLEINSKNIKDESSENINIVPVLEFTGLRDETLIVKFKIGKEKLYILKDVYEFANCVKDEQVFKYGKNLEFIHKLDNFSKESSSIAKFIFDYGMQYMLFNSVARYGVDIEKAYKDCIVLKYKTLDDFFEIMKNKNVAISNNKSLDINEYVTFVEEDPCFIFNIVENEDIGLNIINLLKDEYKIFMGQQHIYVYYNNTFFKCSDEFRENMYPLLKEFESKRTDCIKIEEEFATSFCEYLIPKISKKSKVNIDERITNKYKAEKLATKIYLDIDEKSNIVANVKFCYEDFEFNPFEANLKITKNRNKISESKVMTLFKEYNFSVNQEKGHIFLDSEDDIYTFLTEGINIFMQKFEVLVTDKLKNKQIINTKTLNIGVRIENDLIKLDIENLDLSEVELKDILKKYRLKRKYYRLKDGSFINLESSGIDTLDKLNENFDISEKDIVNSNVTLPKYRAIYLENLINQEKNVNFSKEAKFKEIVNGIKEVELADFKLPKNLNVNLRPYQVTGFNWLKTLDKYGFGGILADDMGLGKTIQVIALLQSYKESISKKSEVCGNDFKTSIVVCPSSLYINWEKEIQKFAPNLKILIISGSAKTREELIEKANEYDVIITSYDLLKRDILIYEKLNFKYAIADEAQYIKNNNTKNAKALKKLNAKTRFALTGTPIENSLAELWSIFDFVMPGYLFSYKKFKENYEIPITKDGDINMTQRLQKIVEPFVLRRIKKEVLKELPDKTESVMYSQMDEKQEKLYKSFLLKAKEEMETEFSTNGFEKSRMKILSIITRLRQICCHPSLFIENYDGNSSKLEQCIQIIEDAISSNHKILLFSGFTSMFNIISKELEKRQIAYEMLTGNTKVDERIKMVDDFNNSKEVKVFLISLKAGGTGLNLTGADIVIHFDPWWNLSAQNQATDRAYRIGQKNNVQVFKLITENSIEEKIINLQNKKKDLTNSVISEKETFISQMSKEEILDLFDM